MADFAHSGPGPLLIQSRGSTVKCEETLSETSRGTEPWVSVLPINFSRLQQQLKAANFGLQPGQVAGLLFASTAPLNIRSRAVLSLWHSRVLSPGLKQPEEYAPQALIPSFSPEEAHGMAPVVQQGWTALLPVPRSKLWAWSPQWIQLHSMNWVMGPSCLSRGGTGTSPR